MDKTRFFPKNMNIAHLFQNLKNIHTHIAIVCFYYILSVSFILEGLGLPNAREYVVALLIIFLCVVGSDYLVSLRQSKIRIQRSITILLIPSFLFIQASFLSIIFSVDTSISVEFFILYLSAVLCFFWVRERKSELEKYLPRIIYTLSVFFLTTSIVYRVLIEKYQLLSIVPLQGYQLVFSRFGSHNHLGDFLVLGLIVSINFIVNKKQNKHFVFLVLFFPFFLFSYSRSAYLAFLCTLIVMIIHWARNKIKFSSFHALFLVLIGLLSFLAIFTTVSKSINLPLLKEVNITLEKEFNLGSKDLHAKRPEYFSHALLSIVERPWLGVGPGNFQEASKRYGINTGYSTETSHNIFLDIFSENGVIAGIFFLMIIVILLTNSKVNLVYFLFLSLLVNFQTDYTYRIYSLFFFFFMLAGLLSPKKIK